MFERLMLLTITFGSVVALTSCNRTPSVPLGPLTQTGTLTATGVSLMRRGTHILTVSGKQMYFVESKTQDLEPFNGKEVVISGIAQANTYAKYMPVIITKQVRLAGAATELRQWQIPALSLSFTLPADWQGNLREHTASFTIVSLTEPILTISRQAGTELPTGDRLYIQGKTGVRVVNDEALTDDVWFIDGSGIVSISFHPNIHELKTLADYNRLHDAFSTMITTLTFTTSVSSSRSAVMQTTGTGAGLPCGGTASVLCPSGYYCAITDLQLGIGKCTAR